MPVLNGFGLIKKIKEELKINTPIIAVTASAMEDDKEKILRAGFNDYIVKPIDISRLRKVLDKYLTGDAIK